MIKKIRLISKFRGSEFSSYEMELRNGVTQNDITLRPTNSKIFIEILLSRSLWNIKLNFELLTRRFNFYFSTFELLARSWKIKKLHFQLLTRRSNFYFFYFWVTNSKLKNKKFHFELLTQTRKILNFTSSY